MQRIEDIDRANSSEDRLRNLLIRGLAGEAPAYHDFLQELSTHLLAVHNQRHTYDAGQPLTAWIHAIAKYKLIDLLRRRSNREKLNDPLDDEMEFFSSADAAGAERRPDLAQLLEQLPDRQRLPIIHMKLEG